MRPRALAALLLLAPLGARADGRWTIADTALEASFAAAVAVDWAQTRWALDNGHRELNPLLGPEPSAARLNMLVLAAAAGHAAVSLALPRPYRRWWQSMTLIVELGAVGHNFAAGARLAF